MVFLFNAHLRGVKMSKEKKNQTHPNLASQINLNLSAFQEICFLDGKYIIL